MREEADDERERFKTLDLPDPEDVHRPLPAETQKLLDKEDDIPELIEKKVKASSG